MIDTILIILAIICFVAATLGVSPRGINLGWLGLALWAATALT